MVRDKPRDCDIVLIDSENFADAGKLVSECAGFAIDLDSLPRLNGSALDGLLVALRCIAKSDTKVMLIRSVNQTNSLHHEASHHGCDVGVSVLDDGSGICAAASLPIIGKSSSNLSDDTISSIWLPWSATSEDLVIACSANISFVICQAPDENISSWLAKISSNLSAHLNRIGLNSIDALTRANLRACDQDTAAVSGLRLAGYDRPLPHWFAR